MRPFTIRFVTFVLLIALFLAGCGGTTPTNNAATPSSVPTATPTTEPTATPTTEPTATPIPAGPDDNALSSYFSTNQPCTLVGNDFYKWDLSNPYIVGKVVVGDILYPQGSTGPPSDSYDGSSTNALPDAIRTNEPADIGTIACITPFEVFDNKYNVVQTGADVQLEIINGDNTYFEKGHKTWYAKSDTPADNIVTYLQSTIIGWLKGLPRKDHPSKP